MYWFLSRWSVGDFFNMNLKYKITRSTIKVLRMKSKYGKKKKNVPSKQCTNSTHCLTSLRMAQTAEF